MIFGIAVGDVNGLRITLRSIGATQGKTCGIEMVETLVNAFVGTDSEGQFAEEHITAIRMDLIERAPELKPIEHLGVDSSAEEEVERFIGKKLRREGQGFIGKAQAIEDHPSDGFPRCKGFLLIGRKACIDHVDES